MARGRGRYADRDDAGRVLAGELDSYREGRVTVLAIPNGGVPVGLRVRDRLGAAFGVIVVRKLHIPWNREAGFGAVAPDGSVAFNEEVRRALGLTPEEERLVIEEEKAAIADRVASYGARDLPPLKGGTAIVVDDGLASGHSMRAAVRYVRHQNPSDLVVAVPTASASAVALVRPEADRLICPDVRSGPVFAVADAYRRWYDVPDGEVRELLRAAGVLGRGPKRT